MIRLCVEELGCVFVCVCARALVCPFHWVRRASRGSVFNPKGKQFEVVVPSRLQDQELKSRLRVLQSFGFRQSDSMKALGGGCCTVIACVAKGIQVSLLYCALLAL